MPNIIKHYKEYYKLYIKLLIPYFMFFFTIQFILRITLLYRSCSDISNTILSNTLSIFTYGLLYDFATVYWIALPILIIFLFTSHNYILSNKFKYFEFILRFIFIFALLFEFVAEHLFWTEFNVRFNFIAVDYLVYTHEIIGNIWESYNIILLISCIILIDIAIVCFSLRNYKNNNRITNKINIIKKIYIYFIYMLITLAIYFVIPNLLDHHNNKKNNYIKSDNSTDESNEIIMWQSQELAKNGIYSLFEAFTNNELDYNKFYLTRDNDFVNRRMHKLLDSSIGKFESDGKSNGTNDDTKDNFIRDIRYSDFNDENLIKKKNVILVMMESMSADYMEVFGNKKNLTPNLDSLASKGLLFTNVYATGTRTVRGLEAVALSLPPIPGQSIVRRPGNENLFSLGFIFKEQGYDTKFIYGGYGYFDNMNNFFYNNGFDIIDRTNLINEEITFSNIWGVADDDIFSKTIKEADKSNENKKPFFYFVMTTSNHRPYTYLNGKIDIPSKTGKEGGVKYADYSIGKLMEWAKNKEWFNDTIFVFIADHTAGCAGKSELDPKKYHIPLIIYSPTLINHTVFDKQISQIDIGPTILGLLKFNYKTKFYGYDVLNDEKYSARAFVSNYQKIALLNNDLMTILSPKNNVKQLKIVNTAKLDKYIINENAIDDAISYYQSASNWRNNNKK